MGSLWVSMGHYGSRWVSLAAYGLPMGPYRVSVGFGVFTVLFPSSTGGFGTPKCCSCPQPWPGQHRASYRTKVWAYGVLWGPYGGLWGAYGGLWGVYGGLWGVYGGLWGVVEYLWGAMDPNPQSFGVRRRRSRSQDPK